MNELNTYQVLDLQTNAPLFSYSFRGEPLEDDIIDGPDGEYKISQVGGKWINGYPCLWAWKASDKKEDE